MRTTVEIPDALLEEARSVAAAESTTLRSLLVEGLRSVLAQREKPGHFRLKDLSVPGKGLQPGIAFGSWEGIRDLTYRGRGS